MKLKKKTAPQGKMMWGGCSEVINALSFLWESLSPPWAQRLCFFGFIQQKFLMSFNVCYIVFDIKCGSKIIFLNDCTIAFLYMWGGGFWSTDSQMHTNKPNNKQGRSGLWKVRNHPFNSEKQLIEWLWYAFSLLGLFVCFVLFFCNPPSENTFMTDSHFGWKNTYFLYI